jgi:ferrous iron transport protein B
VVIWSLSSFPRNIEYKRDYAAEKTTVTAMHQPRLERALTEEERIDVEKQHRLALAKLDRQKNSEHIAQSYMGRIGRVVAPFFTPLGIDWRGGVALLTGFVAKEVVVSTLGVLYAAGGADQEAALQQALQSAGMTARTALSMMVFVLLYLPCLATVAAIRKETGSYKWMFFSIAYSTTIAWIAAFLIYQLGGFFGLR